MSDYDGLLQLAWKRYHDEPIFHARVHHAVLAVRSEAEETGFTWPEMFDGLLKAAAAAALLISEIHDEETGDFNISTETNNDSSEAEMPCRTCGEPATVFYKYTPLDDAIDQYGLRLPPLSNPVENYGLCDEHAPNVSVKDYLEGNAGPWAQ